MAITSAGYYGSVDDARWALLWNNCPIWFDPAAFVATAVASARRVSLTAGVAFAAGIRDTSDGAATVDLNPPSSGGQWYLLVLRRTWIIGTGGTTTVVPLLGPTTDGTTPAAAPVALPTGFSQTPANTYDASIAWVHVRAADTTLTVFDVRAVRSGTGGIVLPSLHALAHATNYLPDGAVVALAPTLLDGTSRLYQSAWQRVNNQFRPVPGSAFLIDSTPSIAASIAGLTALYVTQQAYATQIAWPQGQRARDAAGFEYGWARAGAAWTLEPGPTTRAILRCVGNPGSWADNSNTAIRFDTAYADPMGMFNAGGDGRRILYPVPGRYRVSLAVAPSGGDVANVSLMFPLYSADGQTPIRRDPGDYKGTLRADNPARTTQEIRVDVANRTGYAWAFRNDGNASRNFSYGDDSTRPELVIEYMGPLGGA